jgi:two-component system sensor histidine kinase KdpD
MLYLGAVLLTAVLAGRGPAITASIGAFLAFDLFFTEPRLTLTVRDPDEWIALVTFLVIAVVTAQLAAAVRERAESAEAREREARLLHDLSDLLGLPSLTGALEAVSRRLADELGIGRIGIVVQDHGGERVAAGDVEVIRRLRAPGAAEHVLTGGKAATASKSGSAGRWMRISPPRGERSTRERESLIRVPIRHRDQVTGHIGIVAAGRPSLSPHDARLLDTAADQVGLAVERDRLRTEAMDAEVLRRTDELKSALLDAVSHDLRTPLAGIIASAGSIRQTDVEWTDAERAEFAGTIESEAQRLNRIVGNLLDLSRIQGGMLRPERGWHDPSLLVRDSVERLRAAAHEHRLVVDVPDDLAPAFVDPVEFDQIVANLVENALKYTPAGSEVRVVARDREGALEVAVEDSGPGLSAASVGHLFEPFFRASQSGRAVPGSGLGLAVARGLVRAHGGEIAATNRPGGGARFMFRIPSPPPPEEAA